MIMNAKEFIENKAKSEWGLRLILKGIGERQKPLLYRLIELFAQEQLKSCSKPDVVEQSERLCHCGKQEDSRYSPCCSLEHWHERFS